MANDNLIPLMVPRENKGLYVKTSRGRGMRLQDWAAEAMNLQYDFDRFTLGIPALTAFEGYVMGMSPEQAKAAFREIASLDAAQDDAVADIKMVKGYLEKRLAIDAGWGAQEGQLQQDIAADMLQYFQAFPQTSASLMRVLLDCDAATR